MNIKQKNKKQNCVIITFILSGFQGNVRGIRLAEGKRKKSNHEKQHKE
jgi:hypothetical protein